MKIKFIKLINNERTNRKLMAVKACESTSQDICTYDDNADCKTYAYDECGKDYAACYNGADDICAQKDESVCSGAGTRDTATKPY